MAAMPVEVSDGTGPLTQSPYILPPYSNPGLISSIFTYSDSFLMKHEYTDFIEQQIGSQIIRTNDLVKNHRFFTSNSDTIKRKHKDAFNCRIYQPGIYYQICETDNFTHLSRHTYCVHILTKKKSHRNTINRNILSKRYQMAFKAAKFK